MTAEVQALYSRFNQLHIGLQQKLANEAAFSGRLHIFQYLFDRCELKENNLGSFLVECILESIKGENIDELLSRCSF